MVAGSRSLMNSGSAADRPGDHAGGRSVRSSAL